MIFLVLILLFSNLFIIKKANSKITNDNFELSYTLLSDRNDEFQMYYDETDNKNWSEDKSQIINYKKIFQNENLKFYFPLNTKCIRLDFGKKSKKVKISDLKIKYNGKIKEIILDNKIIEEKNDISEIEGNLNTIKINGKDPYISFSLDNLGVSNLLKNNIKYNHNIWILKFFYCLILDFILCIAFIKINYFINIQLKEFVLKLFNIIKNKEKRKLLYCLFFYFILVIEGFFSIKAIKKNTIEYTKNLEIFNQNTNVMKHLHENGYQKQYINSEKNNLSGIKLKFDTFDRVNTDIVKFMLYDAKTNELLREKKINTSLLNDDKEYNIDFKPLKNSKERSFYFRLVSLAGNEKNRVTVYKNTEDNSILYDLGYVNLLERNTLIILVLLILFINFIMIIYLNKKEVLKKEKIFLIFSLIYGIPMLFLFPPFQIPDENVHFYRAYAIAEGKVIPDRIGNYNGNPIPSSISKLMEVTKFSGIVRNPNGKLKISDLQSASFIQTNRNELSNFNQVGAAIYNPLSYIPQIIGIKLGEVLNLPILFIFYLARIFNFSIWVLVIYLAIKKVPKLKNIFLLLTLNPIGLQQGISLSPDAMLNAFSLLFFSYLFYLYLLDKEVINWKYTMIFFLGIFIPSTIKIVYFLLIILLIGLPLKKYKKISNFIIIILGISIITLVINLIWGVFAPENPINTVGQINVLKHNIFDYIEILYLTTREMMQFYIESSVGILGWLDTKLPFWLIYSYILILLIHTFSNKILEKRDFKFLISMLLYVIGIYLGVLTGLYIIFNSPNVPYITGVQGRYFLPLIPIMIVLLSSKKISVNLNALDKKTNIFVNFSLGYLLILLLLRYYI